MTNTYAINVTRGKEFAVEEELKLMGLHPWVPKMLVRTRLKRKAALEWYDRPYVGKLMFCVVPAINFREVKGLKHVIGDMLELSNRDIDGEPEYKDHGGRVVPARPGLVDFKFAVQCEYEAQVELREIMENEDLRKQKNAEWVCPYRPGDALKLLVPEFEGFHAVFKDTIKRADHDFVLLRTEMEIFGRTTIVEAAPDQVDVA